MIELGWREWVTLPDLDIPRLRAKIDTGARTSALHVDRQWRFIEAGAPWVGFTLTTGKARRRTIEARAAIFDERAVTDSGGRRGVRVFIQTRLVVAGAQRLIEINLSDRCGMRLGPSSFLARAIFHWHFRPLAGIQLRRLQLGIR